MYFMAGIPSVVTDLPGMTTLVGDQSLGLTAPPADVAAMTEALRVLAADKCLRVSMGHRARELAESRFNWQLDSRRLLGLYSGLRKVG
jgi:glycosyltransferase involved in cell wall biosynthesis